MAPQHGKGLKVMVGASQLEYVKSISFKPKVDKADVTSSGNTAMARTAGLVDGQLTIVCYRDSAATQQNALITAALAGTAQTVKAYENATKYYQMTGLVDFEVSMDIEGVETITFTIDNSDGNVPTFN